MKYLLIDTNCWVDLLRNSIEENSLSQIIKWEQTGKIKLLFPEIISQEWGKQKQIQLKDVKSLNNKTFENVDRETQLILKANYVNIERKGNLIDDLFSRGIAIKVSREVHAEVSIRFSKKQAPFHKNRDSHSDAYLGSAQQLDPSKIPKFFRLA